MHTDNKKKDILVLGERPTQGLDDTMITTEAKYSINFSRSNRKFCLSLHYNSSPVHTDNKKKDILVLGERPTQGLDDTMITTEAKYSINFSRSNRKFCLSLHYNGSSIFYLLMLQKYISSKQKILQ